MASLLSRAPRSLLADVLAERNMQGCGQAGARGPPWAAGDDVAALRARGSLLRWLPWHWYSLDGTGWCYDAQWDELGRCADMSGPVDWNGIVNDPRLAAVEDAGTLPAAHVLALALLAYALSARLAILAWADRRAKALARSARDDEPPPDDEQPPAGDEEYPQQQQAGEAPQEIGAGCGDDAGGGGIGAKGGGGDDGPGGDGAPPEPAVSWRDVVEWVAAGQAWPWQWDVHALYGGLFPALLTLLLALALPLPIVDVDVDVSLS